ncbi:MAG: PAS domain-containing protein [Acidobacteriia bacterium]|nr:PAS domain-containing protein [Terriglobia bacterium]
MKRRLFWKFGSLQLVLFLLVLLVVDTYVVRSLREEYIEAALGQLQSLSHLTESRPPEGLDETSLKQWTAWMALTGTRITVIAPDGKVLADSQEDHARMDNHIGRQEVRDALEKGSGRAVRYSATIGHDLVYLAVRQHTRDGSTIIIRYAVPLERLAEALTGFRRGLWTVSFMVLALAGSASLLFFRALARRIERLKEFSRAVVAGNFRGLPKDRKGDELADLSSTLSQTAEQLDATIRTLREERNQSAAVLASMSDGVVVVGPNQRVIFCNAAFCRAVNIEIATWEGRPVVEVIPNADLLNFVEQVRTVNAPITSELIVGSVRTRSFAVTATLIRSNDTTSGSVIVLHDISELRRLERARRDFAANVSHEFKTPLTAIQGFADTLLSGALEDAEHSRKFVEIIRENAVRLGRLTDDLLKLAQIEAGKLELQRQPVAVSSVTQPCLEVTRLKADQKNLTLETDYRADLPLVNGDSLCLQQVLQNLLDNAVRYSPTGGRIIVRAFVKDSEIVISVSDSGVGIPKAEQERIFERFYRADAARSREDGGTGLGLSIAKHLVEAHGGRIQVQSEVGIGSTFSVFLPRA